MCRKCLLSLFSDFTNSNVFCFWPRSSSQHYFSFSYSAFALFQHSKLLHILCSLMIKGQTVTSISMNDSCHWVFLWSVHGGHEPQALCTIHRPWSVTSHILFGFAQILLYSDPTSVSVVSGGVSLTNQCRQCNHTLMFSSKILYFSKENQPSVFCCEKCCRFSGLV